MLIANRLVWGLVPIYLIVLLLSGGNLSNVSALAGTATMPPIGNNYPAGPAPTAAKSSEPTQEVTLQVPGAFKNGIFSREHKLTVPVGFSVSVYTRVAGGLRFMTFSPDNILFATQTGDGSVIRVIDNQGIGEPATWASGLNQPDGLAFHESNGKMYLYVAETNRVVRYPYTAGQEAATGDPEVIVPQLPSNAGHSTRTIVFDQQGQMYVSTGSSCNVCEEQEDRRAAVTRFNDDGSNGKVFAAGLRNGVGLAFNPTTGELWETENSRDLLGDDMPPDEINVLQEGANYGWPYCISNKVWDQDFNKKDQAFCDKTIAPALPLQAHSAPLGIAFYTGKQFPPEYQGDVFVAFHGSWNRTSRTGYKVVRIRVKDGRPTTYEDFMTGFLIGQDVWGRPVDPLVGPDGSLYISDDQNSVIYKVTYQTK